MNAIKILIIEDEDTLAFLLKKMIKEDIEGVDVVIESTGAGGIKYVRENGCDIVILDMKLPDIDGIDVLYEIKSISPSTEVILMTAYPDVELAVKGLTAGAYDYFTKPFSSTDIKKSLTNAIDKIKLEREKDELIENLLKVNRELNRINKEMGTAKKEVENRLNHITEKVVRTNMFLDNILRKPIDNISEIFPYISEFLMELFNEIEYVSIFTKERDYLICMESRGNMEIFTTGMSINAHIFKDVIEEGKEYIYENIKDGKNMFCMPMYLEGKVRGMIGLIVEGNEKDPFMITVCKLINIVIDNLELSLKTKRSYLEFLYLLIKSLEKQSKRFFVFLKSLGDIASCEKGKNTEKSTVKIGTLLFGISVISGNPLPGTEEEFIQMVKASYNMISHIPAFDMILPIMEDFINKKGRIYECFSYMWKCFKEGKDISLCKKDCRKRVI